MMPGCTPCADRATASSRLTDRIAGVHARQVELLFLCPVYFRLFDSEGLEITSCAWERHKPCDYPHGFVADREAPALSTDKISAAWSRAHDGFADRRRKILARFLSDRRQTSACAFGSPHATISFTGGAGPFGAAFVTSVNALASMSSDMSEPAESRIAAAEEWRRTSAKSPIPFAP